MRNLICKWSKLSIAVVVLSILIPSTLAQNTEKKTAKPTGSTPLVSKGHATMPIPKASLSLQGMGNSIIRTATREEKERYALSSSYFAEGNGYLDKKKPDAAITAFQQVLEVDPTVSVGLEMGQAYAMKGQWLEAIKWYRKDIYPQSPYQPQGGAWGSSVSMLEYAMLLLKTGQTAEAATIYNASLKDINWVGTGSGGLEPAVPVLLPAYDSSQDNAPGLLEALVHVGRSTSSYRYVNDLAEADAAIKLVPGLAIAHYYRAAALSGKLIPSTEAAAEYRKAAQLGDDTTAGAARTALERPEFKKLTPTDTK